MTGLLFTTPLGSSITATSYADEVAADAPILWWKLNEASGTVVTDSSGTGLDGAISGTITVNQAPLINAGTSYLLGGGYIQGPATTALNLSTFTVELWTYMSSSGNRAIAQRDGVTRCWYFRSDTSSLLEVGCFTSGGNVSVRASAGSLALNTPQHLVFTVSGTTVTIYVNGVQKGTGTLPATINTGGVNTMGLRAGQQGATNPYAGRMDEIAFYGTALSPARIAAHYAAGIA